MTSPVAIRPRPLTQQDCAGLRWRSPADYSFAGNIPSVLLSASDLAAVTLELPWFFIPSQGKWCAVAPLRRAQDNECLWLDADGLVALRWLPFLLRMYPFTVLPDGDSHVLGLWQDPDCVGKTGKPLFENGNLSPALDPVARAFGRFVAGLEAMHKIGTALSEAGILLPVRATEDGGNLYNIDEEALRSTPPDTLALLAQNGALGAAHAQLLSRHHIKYRTIRKVASQSQNTPVTREADRAFLDALTDDLLEGAELKPGALAP